MSETQKDDFFEKLKDKYAFLRIYPRGQHYSSFILNNNIEPSFNEICSDLSKKDSTCDLRYICMSTGRLLSGLKDKLDKKLVSNLSKECEYLNYWIYYIIKDYSKCDNIELLYERLNLIKSPFIPDDHSCVIQKFEIDEDEFLTMKKLFFHAEILDWLKNKDTFIRHTDKDSYNQYFQEVSNIYKGIISNVGSNLKATCSNELGNFRENFNDAISYLEGKGIIRSQAIKPLVNESLCPNKLLRTEAGSELPIGQRATLLPLILRGEEGQRGTVGPGEKEERGEPGRISEPRVLPVKPELSGPPGPSDPVEKATLSDQDGRDQDSNGNFPEEVRPNKISTIASSLAGSCFFLGMMYKRINYVFKYGYSTYYQFTPMGSWINTKVLGKNKLMDNMENNHYDLLLNDVGNREMSVNDTMYHISYNSAAN